MKNFLNQGMWKNAVPNDWYQSSISASASPTPMIRTVSQTFSGLSILLFNYPPFIHSPPESRVQIPLELSLFLSLYIDLAL